jgi:hypothetical protein
MSALPVDTCARVKELQEKENFPLLSTTTLKYDADVVGLLSNFASWCVHESFDQIQDLVNKAPALQ